MAVRTGAETAVKKRCGADGGGRAAVKSLTSKRQSDARTERTENEKKRRNRKLRSAAHIENQLEMENVFLHDSEMTCARGAIMHRSCMGMLTCSCGYFYVTDTVWSQDTWIKQG